MTTWTPVTTKDNPTAHIRTDGIEFCLTQSDQSKVALARAEAMAAVKKANQHDADIALKQWRGSMHRVGEDLT